MKPIFMALIASLALAGCETANVQKNNRVSQGVDLSLERLGSRNATRAGGAQFTDGVFVGAAAEKHSSSALLPSNLQVPGAIHLYSRDAMNLAQISQRLSEMTGISHVLALGPTGKITSPDDSLSAPEPETADDPINQIVIRPDLRGSLSDVLNEIAATFEVEWSYADGRILFRDYVTRKYQITALPTTSKQTTAIGSGNLQSASSVSSDIWGEVKETLDGLLEENASVSIGATTGLVTVTARISDQDRVLDYIKKLNANVGQQITFDVQVLNVSLNDQNNFGLDLGAAFNAGSGDYISLGGSSSSGAIGDFNIGVANGDFSLNAMIDALSTQGQVSVATRAGATTSNNRPAPIEVVDEVSYVKEFTTETDDDGNETTTIDTDVVTTGFEMQLFPRIMNNRDIMVQYTVRLSELNALETFESSDQVVQLPEISTTSFEQQAVLENGQTLILAGFERERISVDKKTGLESLTSFGASQKEDKSRVATVMMITPRIISRNQGAH
jgi:hypothetical protein